MLIRAYLPKIITALFGGLFIAFGILTFDNGGIFDRVFLGVLLFTAIICRHDINVVSIVTILLAQLLLEELVWLFWLDNYIFKVSFYICGFWVAYTFRYDWGAKVTILCLILASITELYWHVADYDAPMIFWHVWIMISNITVRFLIFSRVGIVHSYFPKTAKSINLDWIIYKLSGVVLTVQALMIVEYTVRHLSGINILTIYHSYPYLLRSISVFSVWAIFHENNKLLIPKLIKA
ncbi:hypothetical protein [uncultured Paraglaciecola sp.]|uniref:hypothetical protein n=1 Tax=uncultured Paraglaciecola sp. TaxID=1765024 RepID=UPI002592BDF4|nr:hypothetical protein [uncultured Paraglaciecola sp.]